MLSGPPTRNYPENATEPVAEYEAPDPDEGDTVTWSLAGSDSGLFTINGGFVSFGDPPDHEARNNPTYNVIVQASDGLHGDSETLTTTHSLAVTVTDVNEPPSVTAGPDSVSYAENDTTVVGRYSATDPDAGDTFDWELSGVGNDDFEITTGGVLTFKAPPNFESLNNDNPYEITVEVVDEGDERGSRVVTVTVTDVAEPGRLTLSSQQPHIGFPLTATLDDPDDRQTPPGLDVGALDQQRRGAHRHGHLLGLYPDG